MCRSEPSLSSMMGVKRGRRRAVRRVGRPRAARKRTRGGRGQKGGIFPLLALIPALAAAGKAAALGAVSAGAGYGVKRAIKAASR